MGADVQKDKTFIFNKYDEDESEIPLEIETITLRNLIDIWLNEHTKLTTEKITSKKCYIQYEKGRP